MEREMCKRCCRPRTNDEDWDRSEREGYTGGEDPHLCWGHEDCSDAQRELIDRLPELVAENERLKAVIADLPNLPSFCDTCLDAGREPPRLKWDGHTLACPKCGADGLADDPA